MLEDRSPLEAELIYKSALLLDDTCVPAHDRLAVISIDQGEYDRAIRHLQANRYSGNSDVIEALRAGAAGSRNVGRNDPCPCGSGKKFQTCHLGRPLPGAEPGFGLADRVTLYMTLMAAGELDELAGFARFDEPDDFVVDLAMFEGGLLQEYLDRRGPLLSSADRQELERWSGTDRAVHEVTSVQPGVGLGLRRIDTGEHIAVAERTASEHVVTGTYLLCRTTTDDAPALIGNVLEVSLRELERSMLLVEANATEYEWAEWYGSMFDPPVIANRDGHTMNPLRLEFEIPGSEAQVRTWLNSLGDADNAGQWTYTTPIDNDDVAVASITLEESTASAVLISAEVNSEERSERIIELVQSQFSDARIVDIEVMDFGDQWYGREVNSESGRFLGGREDSPEAAQLIADYLTDYYVQWLDMDLPALRGMSPRQAASDPTMIGDLRRLLHSLGGGPDFDAEAVAATLGIEL